MFTKLIKISDKRYKLYKRSTSTSVLSIPKEYVIIRDITKGQYLYAFYVKLRKETLLCYSEYEIKGTKRVKAALTNGEHLRLTVPKIILNTLKHNDKCRYEAYHNDKGLLIFKQKRR